MQFRRLRLFKTYLLAWRLYTLKLKRLRNKLLIKHRNIQRLKSLRRSFHILKSIATSLKK
jgi:hypothetical protein